ncbi:MAG: ABC transporter permease [Alphaproteobacteria bacterium]
MDALLTQVFIGSLLFGAVSAGVPLLLAGLGEQISEKAGILNIGLEGMMLVGAYAGFSVTYLSGSFELGFLAGALAGLCIGMLMGVLCVWLKLNQIVVGIAITLGAEGVTALLHHFQFSRSYPRLGKSEALTIPFLSDLPYIGEALFSRYWLVYAAVALVFLLVWIYRHSIVGLNLQAAGDNPAALDAAGVNVSTTRFAAVSATGALGGLGGAYMSTIGGGIFLPFMTGGAGFIAIVLAMLARGNPTWVLGGALLFGSSLSMTTALQVAGVNVPTDVIQMLPFALVMVVLVVFARHSYLPPALAIPYYRGER